METNTRLKSIKKNEMEIVKLKNTVSEIRNQFHRFKKEARTAADKSIVNIQIKEHSQREWKTPPNSVGLNENVKKIVSYV